MKKLLVVMFVAMLVLGACGGNNTNDPQPDEGNNNVENDVATGDSSTYDLDNGQQVYRANCAGCHGGELGGASGPPLLGYSAEDVIVAIQEGPGPMTPNMVDPQEAEDVAAWIAAQ
ncbi:cytochrome c [Evansella sp. AB-P1]|uniref:c-type cytochrome n=1 Tax=Evansella sp. AB-P1 TaxID=3037653 RepID=UPI00241E9E54|nr:cytochrome c [Evansella sp. AB-P1]MDG5786641.1 cytochrome c [Evansella sp. AB-P1]